jgi:hypothetical protein
MSNEATLLQVPVFVGMTQLFTLLMPYLTSSPLPLLPSYVSCLDVALVVVFEAIGLSALSAWFSKSTHSESSEWAKKHEDLKPSVLLLVKSLSKVAWK